MSVGVIVFGEPSHPLVHHINSKVGISGRSKCVPESDADSHTCVQFKLPQIFQLRFRQAIAYWNIEDDRVMVRVHRIWVLAHEMIGRVSKIRKRKRQKFYPTLVRHLIGRSSPLIAQSNPDSWRFPIMQFFRWIPDYRCGNNRTLAFDERHHVSQGSLSGAASLQRLPADDTTCDDSDDYKRPIGYIPQ